MPLPLRIAFCLLFTLLWTACRAQPTLLPIPQSTETAAVLTSIPIGTAVPAATPLPLPTPSSSPSPSISAPTPTPDLSAYKRQAWASHSSHGPWSANVVVSYPENPDGSLFGDQYHALVKVVNSSTSQTWWVVDEWLNYGLGYTTPQVLGWSGDGRYLYLGDTGVPDGCGPRFTRNLRRVELATGEVSSLGIEVGRLPSISPDGEFLVSFGESGLLLHDLITGEASMISFEQPSEEWWPGSVGWSLDREQLIFTLWLNPCNSIEARATRIVLVDLGEKSSNILVPADPSQLAIQSWPEPDYVFLRDRVGNSWWLEVNTGEIESLPPQDIAEAQSALSRYFAALHAGRYTEAVQLYGGSYQGLEDNNPDVDPEDKAALLQNACQVNGFQCLEAATITLERVVSQDEYHFTVTFRHPDGSPFQRGPCCGADLADMPPESEFTYTVIRDPSGKYLIQDLPVYVP